MPSAALRSPPAARAVLGHAFPWVWLAAFLFFVFGFSAPRPAPPAVFAALALAGWGYGLAFERERLRSLLAAHRGLFIAAWAVCAAIVFAGGLLELRHGPGAAQPLPAQVGLLPALAPLALVLADRARLRAVAAVFAAVSLLHLFALPFEAVTGTPLRYGTPLFPRELGPLNFQARGLAWQVYYFAGLYAGLFYLAAGAAGEERLFGEWQWSPRTWLAASLAWTAAVACLQSRSAFAGALAAALAGLLVFARVRHRRVWLAAAALALAGAALFWLLFATNKSSAALRWVYLLLYLRRSFDPEWLWSGRGYSIVPDTSLQVPGYQFVDHAHNDLVQVLFTWGLATFVAYLVFWGALLRLAVRFWRAGRAWPVLVLVATGPSFVTDLGLHHPEKAALLVLLAAMAVAAARLRALRP